MRDNYRAAAERVQSVPTPAGSRWSTVRMPVGRVHAIEATTRAAACGYAGTLYEFGAWRDGVMGYCGDCLRLVPFEE